MTNSRGPRALPTNFIAGFLRGVGYPLEALGFIRKNSLWSLATWPTVVNVVLFIIVIWLGIVLAVPWIESADQALTPASDEGIWNTILSGLSKVVSVLMWIVVPVAVLVFGSAFIVIIGQAVASPFLDALSEKVETLVLGTEPAPFTWARTVRSVVVACADVVWTVVFFLAVNLPLLLINLIPVLGSAANAIIGFGFAALLLSQEFVGLSMARRLMSYPARWRVVWANKWIAMGCGATTMVLFIVPGLNLILLPLATVGGTLLYCDLKAAGQAGADPK